MNNNDLDWLNLGDPTNVVRVIGFLLPLLTALLTKHLASARTKALVTTFTAAVVSATAYLVTADGYDWTGFVNAFVNTYLPAVVGYVGLWKPTLVAGKLSAATSTFGVGRTSGSPPPTTAG
jgi:hypothetical protein